MAFFAAFACCAPFPLYAPHLVLGSQASSATKACPAARLSPPWSLPAARQGLLLAARRTRLFGFDLALLLLLLGLSIRHAIVRCSPRKPFFSTRRRPFGPLVSSCSSQHDSSRFVAPLAFGLLQDGPRAA